MPFTPTHLAAIVPIAKIWRGFLPLSALAIGSMIPDWPIFAPLPFGADYSTTHSLIGLVTACLPLGLSVYFVFQKFLKRPLADLLPRIVRGRVRNLADFQTDLSISGLVKSAIAIVIGAGTHLLWDSFTHQDRWGTRLIPTLERAAITLNGHSIPGYKLFQYGSTVVLLPTLLIWLAAWLSRRPPTILEDDTDLDDRKRLAVWIGAAAVPILVTAWVMIGDGDSAEHQVGRAITMSGRILALSLLGVCLVDRRVWFPLWGWATRWVGLVLAVFFTILGVSSYFAYTTVGFDFERPTADGVDALYLRIRWDDGSTWVGFAIQPCARPTRPLDWFDPGGTILVSSTRPIHGSGWNDLGFWRVDSPSHDPYTRPR